MIFPELMHSLSLKENFVVKTVSGTDVIEEPQM